MKRSACLFLLLLTACGATVRPLTRADADAMAKRLERAADAIKAHDFETAGRTLDALQRELETWRTRTPDDLGVVELLAMVHLSQAQRLQGVEAVQQTRPTHCSTDADDPHTQAVSRHVTAGRALLRHGCDRGSAEACANLGVTLLAEVCGERTGVVEAYQKGCAGGVTRACTELGNFYAQGHFVDADPVRSKGYFEQSCSGGDPTGCAHLGIVYDQGLGVEVDGARAVRLYRDACTAGSPVGCNALGLLHQRGRHVEADMGKARQLFETACDQAHPHACTRLAEFHLQGAAGLTADQERAAAFFNRGCIARSAQGCLALGVMHERRMIQDADMGRATRLYSMACRLGHPSGCFNVGNGYARGDALPQDFGEAIKFWQRACDGGHQRACLMRMNHDENGPIAR